MRRFAAVATAVAAGALAGLVPAAHAAPPTKVPFNDQFVVEDQGQACGFPVRWEISATGFDQLFFDEEGNLERILSHTRESNVLTNVRTGQAVRDFPKFNQIVHFAPDGSITSVETMGLFVNARRGQERVMDVGKVIIGRPPGSAPVLLFAAGRHPFREVTLGGLQAGLGAFCDILS